MDFGEQASLGSGSFDLSRVCLRDQSNDAIKGILQQTGDTPLAIREWIVYCHFMTWRNNGSHEQAEQYMSLLGFIDEVAS